MSANNLGFRKLAKEIILVSIKDYVGTYNTHKRNCAGSTEDSEYSKKKRKEILDFFDSDWGDSICGLVGVGTDVIKEFLENITSDMDMRKLSTMRLDQ